MKTEENCEDEDTGAGRWLDVPPTKCDICQKPIEDEFVDGEMANGMWAITCSDCHEKPGCGVGPGVGQRYRKIGDKWPKVEG